MSNWLDLFRTVTQDEATRKGRSRRTASYREVCSMCGRGPVHALGLCRKHYHQIHPRLRVDLDLTSDPELYAALKSKARKDGCSLAALVKNICREKGGVMRHNKK